MGKEQEIIKEIINILRAHDIECWLDRENKTFAIYAEDCNNIDSLLGLFGSFLVAGFKIIEQCGVITNGFGMDVLKNDVLVVLTWAYLHEGVKAGRWVGQYLPGEYDENKNEKRTLTAEDWSKCEKING